MNENKRFVRQKFVCFVVFCCVVFGALPSSAKAVSIGLSVEDCIKCHKKEPAEIESKGMAHKT